MLNFINSMAHLLDWQLGSSEPRSVRVNQGVAQSLMQSADARQGLNPHDAAELRRAARAFLSVVR